MKGCRDCGNAIFCEQMGDYKCKVFEMTIPNPGKKLRCPNWKAGAPSKSKRDEEEE